MSFRDPAEERLERETEEYERQQRADRVADHTPTPVVEPAGEVGAVLYKRAGIPGDVDWAEMSPERRAVWAQAEQHLRSRLLALALPGALRVHGSETAVERHERHVQAVMAVLKSQLLAPIGVTVSPTMTDGSWMSADLLRQITEAVLAAVETGI